MRIEVAQDTFGYLVKLGGTSDEFAYALARFKDLIALNSRHYIGERKAWRVEQRAGDDLAAWLNEMSEASATIIDSNAQAQERAARIESGGDQVRARLLLSAAHKTLLIRTDAPPTLAEASYTILKSQTTNEIKRAELEAAIATVRAKGQVESAA